MSEFLKLNASNCKNCYKCIRHCPVKSIRFTGERAHIIPEECILCGQCFVVCPQNAKEIADGTEDVRVLLSSGAPVIASVAPSFIANYDGVGIGELREGLKKLGFADAEETAIGATMVKNEYDRLLDEDHRDVLISSCCHSVNLLIQKHFKGALPYLADVVTPMQAHCADIKRRNPSTKTVFIGPCISKKDEGANCPEVDAVITFQELTEWMKKSGVVLEKKRDSDENSRARLFPTCGGILRTMKCDAQGYTYMAVDGVENCIAVLKDILNGNIHNCFIEMSACSGSCIGGPVMEKYHDSPVRNFMAVNSYAGKDDFSVEQPAMEKMHKDFPYSDTDPSMPSESEIQEILHRMGKNKPSDELNCGTCGYNTCREKAIAIWKGKADISMCLPFLKERAESFSGNIINNTPNAIIVLNENLEVQQINRAALSMMNLRRDSDVLGEQVVRLLDPEIFIEVRKTGRSIKDKRVYLAEYDRYVEQTVIYDREYRLLICIMRDVTNEEIEKEKKEELSRQTAETADKVVEKQMRIVQEIASLLGETAAETKIALTKLKESLKDE